MKTLIGLNPWLFADYARALDLFGSAIAIGDNPVPRHQLNRKGSKVGNSDLIGKEKAAVTGGALFWNELRFHFDLNALRDGFFGHRGIQISDEGLKSRNNGRRLDRRRVRMPRIETGLMDRIHSADKSVMELVRFPLHSARLALVALVVLAGCSENKRNPPDDGDGDYSKKSAGCEVYRACVADRGSQILTDWGVSSELQAALLDSCADVDVSALPENVQNAQSALIAECAQ